MSNHSQISNTVWNIANLLRGSWKAYEYQDVILPLTVLKRLDAALEPTKQKVLERFNELDGRVSDLRILRRVSGYDFYNTSPFTLKKLLEDQSHIARNFRKYIDGFSDNVKDIFAKFDFEKQLEKMDSSNILYLVLQEFNKIELHPDKVPNHEIGLAFEDLIRRFAEQSNETAGEHYTPRDVVRLMTALIFAGEEKELSKSGIVKTLYDPACGTGGMLTVGKDYLRTHFNKNANIFLYGQELNSATYAICKADMLLKGENIDHIRGGEKEHDKASTLSNDQHFDKKFDYIISNPPYGVEWKKDKTAVENEFARGNQGRFGAGLPRITDGQFLFIQHAISKFKPQSEGGSDAVIITNGSPLFTGDAGGGETEIRRWIIESDYLDALIALPGGLFFNTDIDTYIWILSNHKPNERKGKIMLIDAQMMKTQRRKSLGNKRYDISDEHAKEILKLYKQYKEGNNVKIYPADKFGYRKIPIEQPLQKTFEVSDVSLERFKVEKVFMDLAGSTNKDPKMAVKEKEEGKALQQEILSLLHSFLKLKFFHPDKFLKAIENKANEKGLILSTKIKKAVVSTFGEHDEAAEIVNDTRGNIVPDTELRDFEYVPIGDDIDTYFKKKVEPYINNAWIDKTVCDEKDGKVGKVGYEIQFSRYFYKYNPPRSLKEIGSEIQNLEIDIQKTLRLIDLLTKERQNITNTLTKGLNPNAKMKYSGIEWIGTVPKHWEMTQVKNICTFGKGQGLSKGSIETTAKNECILYGELFTTYKRLNVINTVVSKTNEKGFLFSKGNEILIPGSTTTTGIDLSNAKYLPIKNVILGGDIIILYPKTVKYIQQFLTLFLTYVSTPEFIVGANGVTIYHIYPRQIREIYIALPPISEQELIVDYLNEKTGGIDKIVTLIESQIEKLSEYKSVLIYNAVTGKIKI